MRFQSDSSDAKLALKKKDEFVEFPMNGLDLSGIYSGKKSSQNCIYDLYGVIHHTSTIGIGHYYATIRDDINSDDWHLFNGKISNLFHIEVANLVKLLIRVEFSIFASDRS